MSQNDRRTSPVTRTKDQARATYDRISRWYDLLAGRFEGQYRDTGFRMLAPSEGDTVLEIGVGTGHAILALAESVRPSGRVYGIDISQGMLDIARSRVRKAGLAERVVLVQGDALRLPFVTGFFNGIFMSFTLELFDTPEIPLVLSGCYRTLRSKGRICVVAMSKKGQPSRMTRLYEWLHEKLPQYFDCRPIYVEASLESAGFRALRAEEVCVLGLRVELVLAEKAATA